MRSRRWFSCALVLPALLGGLSACSKVQARTPAEVAALEMPVPPARVAVPVTLPEPEEAPAPTPEPTPPVTPPRRESAPRAAAPPPPAPTPAPVPESAPVLQTTNNLGPIAQQTLALIAQAQRDLDNVNYRDLGAQARAQYDSAQGFIRNARQALQIKNYMYAQQLATKAAAVASALVRG